MLQKQLQGEKMKLTQGIQYYFMFWTLYLPVSIGIAVLFHHSLELFLAGLGIGALGLFVFLFGRLLYLKTASKKQKNFPPPKTNSSDSPIPNLESFRTLFSEQSFSDGGKLQ